ncbi:DUF4902 domain-containing protein [Janthinobacterium sp. ROICE36]|uniref:DUF4902 domain-containing protein n=1 Tax=Janthinobacterium sp. ROICE36 TaxID=2048670 RepID=UPI000C7F4B5C|nr:DUF4902 domain-containing protein [Janthinobacterium sp. ROICE36]PLY39489.1 DUF4902 domain-containing protein [Janthinobacterium sp. ROICE36]
MYIISSDSYIRLQRDHLERIVLFHLLSSLDEHHPPPGTDRVADGISGYTEWLSVDAAPVTIGWDWQMLVISGRLGLSRVGGPRSNLMLIGTDYRDLGMQQTIALLSQYVDKLNWQEAVTKYIDARYNPSSPRGAVEERGHRARMGQCGGTPFHDR